MRFWCRWGVRRLSIGRCGSDGVLFVQDGVRLCSPRVIETKRRFRFVVCAVGACLSPERVVSRFEGVESSGREGDGELEGRSRNAKYCTFGASPLAVCLVCVETGCL
ncbi:unnamed protein product [Cuscuta epithymum]|uniref:Uncharacterized protein n=1 Tax=Cuscuta epithymum TaxID=186058 RepID=A0AAV0DM69_9ASTE|nr:unnamed protein product [Cuscuta epithymum]